MSRYIRISEEYYGSEEGVIKNQTLHEEKEPTKKPGEGRRIA
jgi:hypothetical protein